MHDTHPTNALVRLLRSSGSGAESCFLFPEGLRGDPEGEALWENCDITRQDTTATCEVLNPGPSHFHALSSVDLAIEMRPHHVGSNFPVLCLVGFATNAQRLDAIAVRDVVLREWHLSPNADGTCRKFIPLRHLYNLATVLSEEKVTEHTRLFITMRLLGSLDGSTCHRLGAVRLQYHHLALAAEGSPGDRMRPSSPPQRSGTCPQSSDPDFRNRPTPSGATDSTPSPLADTPSVSRCLGRDWEAAPPPAEDAPCRPRYVLAPDSLADGGDSPPLLIHPTPVESKEGSKRSFTFPRYPEGDALSSAAALLGMDPQVLYRSISCSSSRDLSPESVPSTRYSSSTAAMTGPFPCNSTIYSQSPRAFACSARTRSTQTEEASRFFHHSASFPLSQRSVSGGSTTSRSSRLIPLLRFGKTDWNRRSRDDSVWSHWSLWSGPRSLPTWYRRSHMDPVLSIPHAAPNAHLRTAALPSLGTVLRDRTNLPCGSRSAAKPPRCGWPRAPTPAVEPLSTDSPATVPSNARRQTFSLESVESARHSVRPDYWIHPAAKPTPQRKPPAAVTPSPSPGLTTAPPSGNHVAPPQLPLQEYPSDRGLPSPSRTPATGRGKDHTPPFTCPPPLQHSQSAPQSYICSFFVNKHHVSRAGVGRRVLVVQRQPIQEAESARKIVVELRKISGARKGPRDKVCRVELKGGDVVSVLMGQEAYQSGNIHPSKAKCVEHCWVLLCNGQLVTAVEFDSVEEAELAKEMVLMTS